LVGKVGTGRFDTQSDTTSGDAVSRSRLACHHGRNAGWGRIQAELHTIQSRTADRIASGEIHAARREKSNLDDSVRAGLEVVKTHHVTNFAPSRGSGAHQTKAWERIVLVGIERSDIALLNDVVSAGVMSDNGEVHVEEFLRHLNGISKQGVAARRHAGEGDGLW